ncbi:MAG: acyl carrier protein [Phycisphaerales bacterium]|nr:acyl carrier protein [Phycisphaerales bacterium]
MTESKADNIYATVDIVLREDLKLGDTPIERDSPLFDGTLGLDSLDALMLVSGVEKRLGIKLPNKKLGKKSMENIDSFVTFVLDEMDAEPTSS